MDNNQTIVLMTRNANDLAYTHHKGHPIPSTACIYSIIPASPLALHLLHIPLPRLNDPPIELNMPVRQPAQRIPELDRLDALKLRHLPDDLLVVHLADLARVVHFPRQLLDPEFQLPDPFPARLLVVDTPHVFDLAADEARRTGRGLGRSEGVAVVGGSVEDVGQAFEVELFLLAGFEQGFQGAGVGFHVAETAEVVLIRVFLEALQPFRRGLYALGESVDGALDFRFQGDELQELVREVVVIGLQVAFPSRDPSDDLLDVTEVFVELVGFFAHLDEAFIGFVDLVEDVDEGVGEVVEDAVALVDGVATAGRVVPHVGVEVCAFEEGDEG